MSLNLFYKPTTNYFSIWQWWLPSTQNISVLWKSTQFGTLLNVRGGLPNFKTFMPVLTSFRVLRNNFLTVIIFVKSLQCDCQIIYGFKRIFIETIIRCKACTYKANILEKTQQKATF